METALSELIRGSPTAGAIIFVMFILLKYYSKRDVEYMTQAREIVDEIRAMHDQGVLAIQRNSEALGRNSEILSRASDLIGSRKYQGPVGK